MLQIKPFKSGKKKSVFISQWNIYVVSVMHMQMFSLNFLIPIYDNSTFILIMLSKDVSQHGFEIKIKVMYLHIEIKSLGLWRITQEFVTKFLCSEIMVMLEL